jgi:hypothetical protein
MPTVVKPSLKRTAIEIREVLTLRRILKTLLLAMCVFAVVAGINTGNTAIFAGFMVGVVTLVCTISFELWGLVYFNYLKDWLFHGVDKQTSWNNHFRYSSSEGSAKITILELLRLFGIPVSVFFLSAFLFASGTDKGVWVSGERTSLKSGQLIAFPLVQTIKYLPFNQEQYFSATATTKDGVKISANLYANLRLIPEQAVVVRVSKLADPQSSIQSAITQAITARFQSSIADKNLSELQSTLVLEYNTGKQVGQETLASSGVQWNGVLSVADLHPYFKQ